MHSCFERLSRSIKNKKVTSLNRDFQKNGVPLRIMRTLLGIVVSFFLFGFAILMLPLPTKPVAYRDKSVLKPLPTHAKWQYWDSTRAMQAYELACQSVYDKQAILAQNYSEAEPYQKKQLRIEAQAVIFEAITQKILPHWNETEWDFNGVTRAPTKGVIACGYFVATILQQAGIELDRRKMGQCSSTNLVKALCDTTTIQTFRQKNFAGFWEYLSQKAPDGLYIVGLDRHTGLIAKQKGKVTFTHSRKPRLAGVIFEDAGKSLTLHNSGIHVLGNVLENQRLVERWLGE